MSAGPASMPPSSDECISFFTKGGTVGQTRDLGQANRHQGVLGVSPLTSAVASGKEQLPLHLVVSWQGVSLALPTVISAPRSSPASPSQLHEQ